MPIQRVAQAKKNFAALSQEKRASWNCDVWCVTTRNYYGWAGWTGFVVHSFLRVPKLPKILFWKKRAFMVHHWGVCLVRKPLTNCYRARKSLNMYTHYIYMCVCVWVSVCMCVCVRWLIGWLIHLFIHVFIYIHIIYWPTPLITDLSLWPWASSKVLSSGAASHAKYAAQCLAKAELFRWKRWRKWGKWWSLNSSCRDEPLESLQAGFWLGLVINVMDMVFYNVL